MLKMNFRSILFDCSILMGLALLSATNNASADSKQLLPEVVEKESSRKRIVVTQDAHLETYSSTTANKQRFTGIQHGDQTSGQDMNTQKERSRHPIEVRVILEQVSKEKDILPGIVGGGGAPGGMPQAQLMYQPEVQ